MVSQCAKWIGLGAATRRGDEPARLWAQIHAGWARFGALVELAHGAAVAGDAVSQRAHLSEALTELERSGGDVEELARLSMASGPAANEERSDSAGDVEHPLSTREREVAALVGRGMTNVAIAEQLFISKRTVETHVDHIKHKLRAGSRTEVIAWALRESLDLPETSSKSDPDPAGYETTSCAS